MLIFTRKNIMIDVLFRHLAIKVLKMSRLTADQIKALMSRKDAIESEIKELNAVLESVRSRQTILIYISDNYSFKATIVNLFILCQIWVSGLDRELDYSPSFLFARHFVSPRIILELGNHRFT